MFELIWKRFEHVKTDSEVIELIVPPAQPTRCACIINAGWISVGNDVKNGKAIVLEIIGCIPINGKMVIINGVNINKDQVYRQLV